MKPIRAALLSLAALLVATPAFATETENLGLQILPASAKPNIDGKLNDWDLTGGVYACGDVEHQRTVSAVWLHAMYDADNLYLAAHWVDATPMNNPGSVKGSYGFNGDCLQVRVLTAFETPNERVSHWNLWRDHDGLDAMTAEYGRKFKDGAVNGKTNGASQAFLADSDGKGYVQEIAIPWKILAKEGLTLKAGDQIQITFEPNFSIPGVGRLTIKDVFKPNVAIDRVFTFQGPTCWGYGTLETKSAGKIRPVRLSDGREFPVTFNAAAAGGLPTIDWTGLIKNMEPDGFKLIKFNVPEDGFVSLNIFAPDGTVARQLLNTAFLTKGEHTAKWDGLGTPSFRKPGQPVAPGQYTWSALHHTGIGLRLVGWADNAGNMPWDGPNGTGAWGGDHGNPVASASDANHIYLGWSAGEGSKPLVCTDLNGNVLWKNIRGGIAGASLLASDGQTLFVFNPMGQYAAVAIYRLDAKTGRYTEWSDLKATDLTAKHIFGEQSADARTPNGLAAKDGKVFVSFGAVNTLVVLDAASGKVLKKIDVPKPSAIYARDGGHVDVLSSSKSVVSVDVETGELKTLCTVDLKDKEWVPSLAEDKDGNLFTGIRDGRNQVLVYARDGKFLRAIGREGGRATSGPWTPDGMLTPQSLTIDPQGKLWVTEDDGQPRRISVWDAASGKFFKEFFGATSYGAGGGAISPLDPYMMVGQGAEWQLDPKTGLATCVGTITRTGMAVSRFGISPTKRLYLATASDAIHGTNIVRIFERLSAANYKLRTVITPDVKAKTITVWADQNDDATEQPEEIKTYPMIPNGWITGWYMPMTPDLTFYGSPLKVAVTGWTACGAPEYDFSKAVAIAAPVDLRGRGGMGAQKGHGSVDGKYMLYNGGYGATHSTFDCFDIATGKALWTYPNNFTGVHGSHLAGGPEPGLIRGAFDIVGAIKLPDPVGNAWLIPTNKGEWHVLTEKGFYLTHLFESDPMKWAYPDKAVPGAVLDSAPPGAGEEAFGGEVTQTPDGRVFLQVGHTAFWNVQVVGLESIKALASGTVSLAASDRPQSEVFYNKYLQESVGLKAYTIRKLTPTFTGDVAQDFGGTGNLIAYAKSDASVRSAISYDDKNLYAAWVVKDPTPWINDAEASDEMFLGGDTVDLQLAANPKADKNRREAVLGDVRISIGNFHGKTTAVAYRKVATDKHPKSYNSGTVAQYPMDSVIELSDATFEVKVDKNKGYIVEATIPLATLGITPAEGLKIRGDMGITLGAKGLKRTALRTYWSNQVTGIVSDAVAELRMEPLNWGDFTFGN